MIEAMNNMELDQVDERIMDVFHDSVDTFNKAKCSTVVTKEVVQEMLEKDPEWKLMSKEAKDLLGGPGNNSTKVIYDK